MNTAPAMQTSSAVEAPTAAAQERLARMQRLVDEARAIGDKPLREQVAVPLAHGGYQVVVRELLSGSSLLDGLRRELHSQGPQP